MEKEKAGMEKRRFHRVSIVTKSVLTHKDNAFQGRLENISASGALLSLRDSALVLIRPGDRCDFAVYPGEEDIPLRFEAEVVHSGFSVVGVKFLAMDAETRVRLCLLMEGVPSQRKGLDQEEGSL
jgi:hypothetical protein